MGPDATAVQEDLRGVARSVLAEHSPLRTGTGSAHPLDDGLLSSLGWPAIDVPESFGGSGASFAELAVVLGEVGRAGAATSMLGSAVLGAGALMLLEPAPDRDESLRQLAAGRRRLAVALPVEHPMTDPAAAPFVIRRSGTRLEVSGRADFVPDAVSADRILLVASDGDDVVLVSVAPDAAGLVVDTRPVPDTTRHLATISAHAAVVDPASVGVFDGPGIAALDRLWQRAALAVACDSLGVAGAALDATVSHVKARHQFGRPIGSFQAVKHACADVLVDIALGTELVALAVDAVVGGDPRARIPIAMAKSRVTAAAVTATATAVQLHGGIGYTWDRGLHAYLKRAVLNRSLFGSPASHRRHLALRYQAPS